MNSGLLLIELLSHCSAIKIKGTNIIKKTRKCMEVPHWLILSVELKECSSCIVEEVTIILRQYHIYLKGYTAKLIIIGAWLKLLWRVRFFTKLKIPCFLLRIILIKFHGRCWMQIRSYLPRCFQTRQLHCFEPVCSSVIRRREMKEEMKVKCIS